MRNIRNMFSETSHHGDIPFCQNIHYLGGKGEVRLTGLEKFAYPGQFLQSWPPVHKSCFVGGPGFNINSRSGPNYLPV
jgi:hypothetical protein